MNIKIIYRNRKAGFSIFKVIHTIIDHLKTKNKIEEYFLPNVGAGISDILINCWYVLKLKKKDIIHISGDAHYLCWILPKKRTVITVHDIMYYHYLKGLKRIVWKWLYVNALSKASTVVYISEFAYSQVRNIKKLENVKEYIIPNAVSPTFSFSEKKFNDDCPIILHIGVLDRKNLIRSIKALSGIKCHLRIIGKLSDNVLDELKKNQINFSNSFNLSDEEILSEYRNCDIVNFPSLFEGFGMPIIEGQAMGRVVLTSNIKPMNIISGEGGAMLVDPKDINDIRRGYIEIITNKNLREELIKKGVKNAQNYTVDIIAQKYKEIYNQLYSNL